MHFLDHILLLLMFQILLALKHILHHIRLLVLQISLFLFLFWMLFLIHLLLLLQLLVSMLMRCLVLFLCSLVLRLLDMVFLFLLDIHFLLYVLVLLVQSLLHQHFLVVRFDWNEYWIHEQTWACFLLLDLVQLILYIILLVIHRWLGSWWYLLFLQLLLMYKLQILVLQLFSMILILRIILRWLLLLILLSLMHVHVLVIRSQWWLLFSHLIMISHNLIHKKFLPFLMSPLIFITRFPFSLPIIRLMLSYVNNVVCSLWTFF